MISLLFVLCINNAFAGNNVAFGLSGSSGNDSNYYGLSIGDYNHFDQSVKDNFDLLHYGYGRSSLSFGNGVSLNLAANSGINFLEPTDEPMFALVGLDLSGRLSLNTNQSVHSYYQWFPSLAFGPQWKTSLLSGACVIKGGLSAGNYDKYGILPNFYPGAGTSCYFNSSHIDVAIDYLRFQDNVLFSLDSLYKINKVSFGVHLESISNPVRGLQDNSGSLLFKAGLF